MYDNSTEAPSGDIDIAALFGYCNDACPDGDPTSIAFCISALDWFNNGGILLATGFCRTGTCADGERCNDTSGCPDSSACTTLSPNCATQPLINAALGLIFEPPGPAGSSNACNAARRNPCTLLAPGEANCANTVPAPVDS